MATRSQLPEPPAGRKVHASTVSGRVPPRMGGQVREDLFPYKTWKMIKELEDDEKSDIACFDAGGYGLVVKDERKLVHYLKKHSVCKRVCKKKTGDVDKDENPKISAFYRQLTNYGFYQDTSCDFTTYLREDQNFNKDNKTLLKNISIVSKPKKAATNKSMNPHDGFGTKAELVALEERLIKCITDQSSMLERRHCAELNSVQSELSELKNLVYCNAASRNVQQGAYVRESNNARYVSGHKHLRFEPSMDFQTMRPTLAADNQEKGPHPAPQETVAKAVSFEQAKSCAGSHTNSLNDLPPENIRDFDEDDHFSDITSFLGPDDDKLEETYASPKLSLLDQPEHLWRGEGQGVAAKKKRGETCDPEPKRLRFNISPMMLQLPRQPTLATETQTTSSITTDRTTLADNSEKEPCPALPEASLKPVSDGRPIAASNDPLDTSITPREMSDANDDDLMTYASEITTLFGPDADELGKSNSSTEASLQKQKSPKKRKQDDSGNCSVILHPSETDVLCGEGDYNKHCGNRTHNMLVVSHKDNYAKCLPVEKIEVSRSIVLTIRQFEGRFLERETIQPSAANDTSRWYEIGDDAAIEMTMNALEANLQQGSGDENKSVEQSDNDGDTSGSGDGGEGAGSGDGGHGSGSGGFRPTRQEGGRQIQASSGGGSTNTTTFSPNGTAYGATNPGRRSSSNEEQEFLQDAGARAVSCNDSAINFGTPFQSPDRSAVYGHSAVYVSFGVEVQGEMERLITRISVNDKSLVSLVLRKNEIGPDEAKVLASALRFNTSIKCIDLWNNNVGDQGAMVIISALCQNPAVRRVLSLGQNNISTIGASAIAKILPVTAITSLDLENNNIRADGAVYLAMGLRNNNSLKSLRLGGNRIEDKGTEAIAGSIRLNRCISALYLERNNIGSKGVASFAGCLQDNNVLTVLDLSENDIGGEGVMILADALCQNKSLSTLGLRGNDIGKNGATAIEKMLQKNNVIGRISLDHCSLSNESILSLNSSLKRNENATKVKDDKVALFKSLKSSSSTQNSIAVLLSAPLVWRDDKDNLHRIQDSHNFDLEKALIADCVQKSKSDVALSFDVAVEGVLRAAAVARCSCLHLSGHGYPGYLLFEDGIGGADWLDEDKLYEFVNEDTFRLVFLSGSNTVYTGNAFMKSGVQHVVCCEQSSAVEDAAAMTFTDQFYSHLLMGSTILIAFEKAKLLVLQRFDSVDINKFMLLPANKDHQVQAFESGALKNSTQNADHGAVSSRQPQHQGQEIILYRIIQLVFSKQVVNVVNGDTEGCNSLAVPMFKYMSDRKSVLLDIDDVYYVPCNAVLKGTGTNGPPDSALQQYISGMKETAGAGNSPGNSDMDEVLQKAVDDLRGSKTLIILDDFPCDSSWLKTMVDYLLEGASDVKLVIFSRKGLEDATIQREKLCEAVVLRGEITSK